MPQFTQADVQILSTFPSEGGSRRELKVETLLNGFAGRVRLQLLQHEDHATVQGLSFGLYEEDLDTLIEILTTARDQVRAYNQEAEA